MGLWIFCGSGASALLMPLRNDSRLLERAIACCHVGKARASNKRFGVRSLRSLRDGLRAYPQIELMAWKNQHLSVCGLLSFLLKGSRAKNPRLFQISGSSLSVVAPLFCRREI
jgi:hypothetical protein